ncbi:peptide chain release factor N(5)-glutamine methyltransferase [Candidatus Saccharibacteria bacterium]|nr:peptide chain release factor N(5)-glutamine methyltransferase [Candidatus Saccharibacteria bacterium]
MNTNANLSTTNHWLIKSTRFLKESGIPTARLDCLVLLEYATKKDRSFLLAHPETVLQGPTLQRLDGWAERRAGHEPLSYIRGKSEFYGREFLVNENTLEPRPETEAMIDFVKSIVKSRENLVVADIGTGSGCIAISVKLEFPDIRIYATDIDVKCLEIARENSTRLNANVDFYEGNLLEPVVNKQIDMLLCNLPYVPNNHSLNKAAKFEPRHAIFGGVDGLDFYRQLFEQINGLTSKPTFVLTESLPLQHEELAKIATSNGYRLEKSEDFIQVFSN